MKGINNLNRCWIYKNDCSGGHPWRRVLNLVRHCKLYARTSMHGMPGKLLGRVNHERRIPHNQCFLGATLVLTVLSPELHTLEPLPVRLLSIRNEMHVGIASRTRPNTATEPNNNYLVWR